MDRRRMMEADISGLIPSTYKQVEYIQRGTSVIQTSGYNSTGHTIDASKNTKIEIGFMPISTQQASYGYVLGCRQTNADNTIGRGVYVPQNNSIAGAFNGVSATLSPSGSSFTDVRIDATVNFYADGSLSISDGVNTATESNESPRGISSELYFFGFKAFNGNQNQQPFRGRIYYLNIYENGVLQMEYLPVKRVVDNAVGLYDVLNGTFKTNANYTAGSEVW